MTDRPPSEPAATTPKVRAPKVEAAMADAADAAAIRRRWITLGEVLAVAAVLISGLTLWNSWSERNDSAETKRAEARKASAQAATLLLTATAEGKRTLILKPAADEQSVQSQTIAFPAPLGAAPAETTGEPRIEADWFEEALEKARDAAGLPDDSRGDERLPIVITSRFLAGGRPHEDVALYDVGYTISGRWLSGHTITLRGLSLVSRVKADKAQAMLDARWARLFRSR